MPKEKNISYGLLQNMKMKDILLVGMVGVEI